MPLQIHVAPVNDRIDETTKILKTVDWKQTREDFVSLGWRNDSILEFSAAGTATPRIMPPAACFLVSSGIPVIFRNRLDEPQAARAAILSGFVRIGIRTFVGQREWQELVIPAEVCASVGSENLCIEGISIRPAPEVHITEEAKSMVKQQGLETIMTAIDASIKELWQQGARIKETVVEREIDPEIETRKVLAVTVWMQDASPQYASSFWKLLHETIRKRRTLLSGEDKEKLDRLVSIGVDIE